MVSKTLIFNGPQGLHAKPAGALVKKAKEFESKIELVYNGNSFNAKAIIKLLSSGIKAGAEITVTADGADEEQALASVVEFIENIVD